MDEKLKDKILLEEQNISHRGLSKPSINTTENPVLLECRWELDAYPTTCISGNPTLTPLCFPLSQLLKMAQTAWFSRQFPLGKIGFWTDLAHDLLRASL